MNTLSTTNAWLGGFFAFAAVHYAIKWWSSRSERVLLWFSIYCALDTVFCVAIVSFFQATTASGAQTALERVVTIGVTVHVVVLHFYAHLGGRRDRAFRALVTSLLLFLGALNQWVPLRGAVIEMQTVQLPGGGTGLIPIRDPPGASLALLYVAVVAVHIYGLVIARLLWKRERAVGALATAGALANLAGATIGALVDFAEVRAPYAGAWPQAFSVLCMSLLLAREYSARGARVVASEMQFETAFEHAPIGKALLAPDGRILRVNRALCRMLDRAPEELRERRLQDITREDNEAPDESRRRQAVETTAGAVETCFLTKDGEPVWALLALSVVPDERGRPVQMIAQMQDVTELRAHRGRLEELVATRTQELREAKDEADRANRAKSQFLAHISHEIRTPLHVILGYAQILERDPALLEPQRKKIEIVHSSGKHLLRLLNEVLEMSKIEAGRTELVERPFDLWDTLEEVVRMFEGQTRPKGIELTVERAPELPRSLLGDGAKVTQVLINLVGNAIKFTRKGSIRVDASSSALADGAILVKLVVADTGSGIEAQDLARLFQPFEQADAGTRAGGTGLGLAISLTHARLMRGDLTVESTPGAGSTFTFTFIATRGADAARDAAEEPDVVTRAAARCKVLIADDMADNRNLLTELFSNPGFETRTAVDGNGALAIHTDWLPDLVLIDLRMPGMDGIEAIRRLRAAGSRAAIGALSASALADDEREALDVGADFFLRKPYDDRELLTKIARALDAAEAP